MRTMRRYSHDEAAATEPSLRVLVVSEHASAAFGGEAFLPLLYFQFLRQRGIESWLVSHDRVRSELRAVLPDEFERMYFVRDTRVQRLLCRLGSFGRTTIRATDGLSHLITQFAQRDLVKSVVAKHAITVVHEPAPVSPRQPSALFDVGAPVVIGPMNGGMSYPPAFRELQTQAERTLLHVSRKFAELANWVLPGKRRADLLLVANQRTRRALPSVISGARVEEVVENGVDFGRFVARLRGHASARATGAAALPTFAFVGRLVRLKAVDLLLEAFASARQKIPMNLEVFGDGPVRGALEQQTRTLGVSDAVTFHGFVPQTELAPRLGLLDALVLPSLHECGGAVVLEAMALGLPVVATAWGGPRDYLDAECGLLIEPSSKGAMIDQLTRALIKLAADPELRRRLGWAGREKAQREYDWERKIDTMIGLYRSVLKTPGTDAHF